MEKKSVLIMFFKGWDALMEEYYRVKYGMYGIKDEVFYCY